MEQILFNPAFHPSFKSQFDKLTQAYINGEVFPRDGCACFIGNLLNGYDDWMYVRDLWFSEAPTTITCDYNIGLRCITDQSGGLYTPTEIMKMEKTFMRISGGWALECVGSYEGNLFIAFEKTLDLLKSIHESKGEVIESATVFTKRELSAI